MADGARERVAAFLDGWTRQHPDVIAGRYDGRSEAVVALTATDLRALLAASAPVPDAGGGSQVGDEHRDVPEIAEARRLVAEGRHTYEGLHAAAVLAWREDRAELAALRAAPPVPDENPAVIAGLAESLMSWLREPWVPPTRRVVLLRDDDGEHRGEGVLAVDGRALHALSALAAAASSEGREL